MKNMQLHLKKCLKICNNFAYFSYFTDLQVYNEKKFLLKLTIIKAVILDLVSTYGQQIFNENLHYYCIFSMKIRSKFT